jgi:hypothetical protein
MPTLAAPTFGFPPAVSVLDDLSGVAIHGYPTFDYICVVPRRPETGMTPTDKPQGVGRQNRIAIWSSGFASTGVGGQTRRPFSFSALLLRGVETNRIAIWPYLAARFCFYRGGSRIPDVTTRSESGAGRKVCMFIHMFTSVQNAHMSHCLVQRIRSYQQTINILHRNISRSRPLFENCAPSMLALAETLDTFIFRYMCICDHMCIQLHVHIHAPTHAKP